MRNDMPLIVLCLAAGGLSLRMMWATYGRAGWWRLPWWLGIIGAVITLITVTLGLAIPTATDGALAWAWRLAAYVLLAAVPLEAVLMLRRPEPEYEEYSAPRAKENVLRDPLPPRIDYMAAFCEVEDMGPFPESEPYWVDSMGQEYRYGEPV